jgi:hypothetical protein
VLELLRLRVSVRAITLEPSENPTRDYGEQDLYQLSP